VATIPRWPRSRWCLPRSSGETSHCDDPYWPQYLEHCAQHLSTSTPAASDPAQITPDVSRRSSPPGLSDAISMATTRSVPATPLNTVPNGRADIKANLLKPSPSSMLQGTGSSELAQQLGPPAPMAERGYTTSDLNATLSRLTGTGAGFEGSGYASGMQGSPEDSPVSGVCSSTQLVA
jgi:hypothetical protein